MRCFAMLWVVLCCGMGFAEVRDHLLSVEGKGAECAMEGIDCIYMLTMPGSKRWKESYRQFETCGVHPHLFEGVDGWNIASEELAELGVCFSPAMHRGIMGTWYPGDGNAGAFKHEYIGVIGRTYFAHCLTKGAIGATLSHLSVLLDAYESGHEVVWVLEDRAIPIENPVLLSKLVKTVDEKLRGNWDILYTDRDLKNRDGKYIEAFTAPRRPDFDHREPKRFAHRRDLGGRLRVVGARFGAYSYIINRRGMEKVLSYFRWHPIFHQYDVELYSIPGIVLCTPTYDIVGANLSLESDVEKDHRSPRDEGGNKHSVDEEASKPAAQNENAVEEAPKRAVYQGDA